MEDDTVPVVTITLPVATDVGAHEVSGEQVTHRLAQRPGSYVVLKYARPVVKRKLDAVVCSCPVPATLWPGSSRRPIRWLSLGGGGGNSG